MRIATYNVEGIKNIRAIAHVLTALEADVVCVVGAPSTRRLRAALKGTGLELVVRAGRGSTANAILAGSEVTVRAVGTVPMEAPRGVPERVAAHAILSLEGCRLSVVAVALGLRAEIRLRNADQLLEDFAQVDAPVVLGVDLNDSATSPAGHVLAQHLQDAFVVAGRGRGETYPAREPISRRDVLFVDHRLTVRGCGVVQDQLEETASDHLPVIALIEASAGAAPRDGVDDGLRSRESG